jgi:hypothetical protein
MFITTTPNNKVILSTQLTDRVTDQYPKASIYDVDGNLITTVNLSHIANGLYIGEYTPDGTYKQLAINYVIYSDVSRTSINDLYQSGEDLLYVTDTPITLSGIENSAILAKESTLGEIITDIAEISIDVNLDAGVIANAVWDENKDGHTGGLRDIADYVNNILPNILTDVNMSLDALEVTVDFNTKFQMNAELKNNQLIIYDDDGETPIAIFNLFNKEGLPSMINVYRRERVL